MSEIGRMAGTDFNQVASRAIKYARDETDLSQGQFAIAISRAMGLSGRSRLKQSTLSGWELGTRQVPAGALIAAAKVARISVDDAIGGRVKVRDLASRLVALERAARGGAEPGAVARGIAKGARQDVKRPR